MKQSLYCAFRQFLRLANKAKHDWEVVTRSPISSTSGQDDSIKASLFEESSVFLHFMDKTDSIEISTGSKTDFYIGEHLCDSSSQTGTPQCHVVAVASIHTNVKSSELPEETEDENAAGPASGQEVAYWFLLQS